MTNHTIKTRGDWEDDICRAAKSFTVKRHLGRGQWDDRAFGHFDRAVADASTDRRAMLYVQDCHGQGCMIAPASYDRVRNLIPEGRK